MSIRRGLAAVRVPDASSRPRPAIPPLGIAPDALSVDGEDPAALALTADRGRGSTGSTKRMTALLIAGALISKMLGFGREILMALLLGTSLVADGFRSALTVVLLPLAFVQSESVPAVLIPMHRDWQKRGDARHGLAALTVALTLVALALMIGIQALGPLWVQAIVGGFSPAAKAQTLSFMRVMAFAMPGSVILTCLSAAEIDLGLSRLTTLRASVMNLSIIAGLGVLAATGWPGAIGWAFVVGFDGLAAFGLVVLWREGRLAFGALRPKAVWNAAAEFLRRLKPLLVLPAAEQGNVWVERIAASHLATGTVASLDYARSLTDTALLLISQPVGLAVLSRDPASDTAAQVGRIARPVLAGALPASVFLMLFAPDIARIVYARGEFQETAVLLSSQALRGIALGLWASTLGWILMRMLNSRGRNGTAALILSGSYAVNAAVNVAGWHLHAGAATGPLLLGFGEAARGLVLLSGSAAMLGCGLAVLRLVALASIPAGLLAVVGWELHRSVEAALPRLLAGGTATLTCMALGALLLVPATCRDASSTLRRLLRDLTRRR